MTALANCELFTIAGVLVLLELCPWHTEIYLVLSSKYDSCQSLTDKGECDAVVLQVADEMLDFWCNFVGEIEASPIREVEDRFRPYIDRLVICLCMLCKFDANEVSDSITCVTYRTSHTCLTRLVSLTCMTLLTSLTCVTHLIISLLHFYCIFFKTSFYLLAKIYLFLNEL